MYALPLLLSWCTLVTPSVAYRVAIKDVSATLKTRVVDLQDALAASPEDCSTCDATKEDFAMPPFDSLARVRPSRLIEVGVNKKIADDLSFLYTGSWGNGTFSSKAHRGVIKSTWDADDHPVANKLHAFGITRDGGALTFKEFLEYEAFDPAWQPPQAPSTPKSWSEDDVKKWLSASYGYWKIGINPKGKTLAKAFVDENSRLVVENSDDKCEDTAAPCKLLESLSKFASLDKNHDAELTFSEAFPFLPYDEAASPQLQWNNVACLDSSDLSNLQLPSTLKDDLLKFAGGESGTCILSEKFEELQLQSTIVEFVKRDKRPRGEADKEKLKGYLKFFQIADILPHDQTLDESNNFAERIGEDLVSIHVPTFAEVAGDSQEGILELLEKDIERWLQDVEKGMEYKNKWFFWTDKYNHAKRLAQDVLRWGDGSIHGVPKRPGFQNGRLQGPVGDQKGQFEDVAPRMALFVHLDPDHDGRISFSMAHKYLVAAL